MCRVNSVFSFTYKRLRLMSYSCHFFSPSCNKPHLGKPLFSITASSMHTKVHVSSIAEKLKRKDKVPSDYEIIYRGPLTSYVAPAQCICGGTILLMIGSVVSYFCSSLILDTEFIVFGGLLVSMNGALYSLMQKYVMRLYANKDESYIGVLPSVIPFASSKIQYSKGGMVRIAPTGFLPWRYNKFLIGSKKVILIEHYFRYPSDFNAMLSVK